MITLVKNDINDIAVNYFINEDSYRQELLSDSQYQKNKMALLKETEDQFGTPDRLFFYMDEKGVNNPTDLRYSYPGATRYQIEFVQRITEFLHLLGATIESVDKGFIVAKNKNNKRAAFVVNEDHVFTKPIYKNIVGFEYIYPKTLEEVKTSWLSGTGKHSGGRNVTAPAF